MSKFSTVKNPLILLLGIAVVILLMKECNTPIVTIDSKPEVISTKTDTILIKGKDSVYVKTVDRWRTEYVYNIHPDSMRMDLSDTLVFNDTYYYPVSDSSLRGTIEVASNVKPYTVSFDYSILEKKINTTTSRVDTLTINNTEKVRVNQIYVGGSAVVYPNFKAVFAEVDFVSKKGWMFGGGIGFMDKDVAIKGGFKVLLSTRKSK